MASTFDCLLMLETELISASYYSFFAIVILMFEYVYMNL